MAYAHYGHLARMGGAPDAILIKPDSKFTRRPSDEGMALADQYWMQAIDLFEEVNRPDYVAAAHMAIAASAAIRGDKAAACDHIVKAYAAGRRVVAQPPFRSKKGYDTGVGTEGFFAYIDEMKRKNGCA